MSPNDPTVAALSDDFSVCDARAHPERATAGGDHRFNHLLTALDDDGRSATLAEFAALGDRLNALDRAALGEEDRLTCAVLRAKLDEEQARGALDLHRWSLDPLAGPHLALLELIDEDHPRRDTVDAEALLARLRAAPAHLDAHRRQLRAGLEKGLVAPRLLAERVAAQLHGIVDGGANQTISRACDDLERSIGAGTLIISLRRARSDIILAYAALLAEVRERILPAARTAPGLSALPTGNTSYRALCAIHTTTDLEPGALHAIGRATVAAAELELRAAATRLGFSHPVEARALVAASDERDDPLAPARAFLERAAPLLATAFARLPAARCAIAAVPASQGATSPAAYYVPPADAGARGNFYINLHRAHRPSPARLEVLTAHEALPGHHLQLARALESPSLPEFRRRVELTAYVEGWGLYAERLADELGLYGDAARFALAEHRAWRAARLVVDTGLHALAWSLAEARAFLAAHAPLSDEEIDAEIERQVADPGQALAYTVGEQAITAAREAARARLGAGFSLAAFHERVLTPGALPLTALRGHIEAWDGT